MTIELPCSQCGQRLRVADEFAGRQARCPQCGGITSIPLDPASGHPSVAPQQSSNPYAAPLSDTSNVPFNPSGLPPHRGTLVLVLGILSLVCCAICGPISMVCGPIAWIIGAGDLKAIRSGHMDPAGESQTRAGMVMGIISSVLIMLVVGGYALMVVIAMLAAAFGA